jgi:hypothetical protein
LPIDSDRTRDFSNLKNNSSNYKYGSSREDISTIASSAKNTVKNMTSTTMLGKERKRTSYINSSEIEAISNGLLNNNRKKKKKISSEAEKPTFTDFITKCEGNNPININSPSAPSTNYK